jgi:cytochrome c biogenesis protein ResB
MGRYPELFADMDAQVFAGWFARKGFADPAPTFWLYALLVATGLLAVNAACCTFERLVQIFRGTVTMRRLLPHVMHLAFLGVVLSHLVSAVYGDRIPGVAIPQSGFAPVGGTGWVMRLDRFDAVMAPEGYPIDFSATVTLFRETAPVARGVVRTNEPLFHEGYGIYIKNFGTTPWGAPYAVFDANRDPGAPAILAASLLFTAANLLYLFPSRRTDA